MRREETKERGMRLSDLLTSKTAVLNIESGIEILSIVNHIRMKLDVEELHAIIKYT